MIMLQSVSKRLKMGLKERKTHLENTEQLATHAPSRKYHPSGHKAVEQPFEDYIHGGNTIYVETGMITICIAA